MEYETGMKSIFPTAEELMDYSLISADVENRNFSNNQDTVLTTKDLMDVLAAISTNMNSVADMNSTITDENIVDEIQDVDMIMSQVENTVSSPNTTQSSSEDEDKNEVIDIDTPQPNNTPASEASPPNNNDSIKNKITKITNKQYNKIVALTNQIEGTFKYGCLKTQLCDEEVEALTSIKKYMVASFDNYNEFVAFLYSFVIIRQNTITENIYLLFHLIFILPHPLRYLYLVDYTVFNTMNGYGYHIRLFNEALKGLSSRYPKKYNCPANLNEITDEIEQMLTSSSSKKIINEDVIDIVKEIKEKMNIFTDNLNFVEFIFKENKSYRLCPTGYLLLNMIYVLKHPEKYLYLLRFPLRQHALLRLLDDINSY